MARDPKQQQAGHAWITRRGETPVDPKTELLQSAARCTSEAVDKWHGIAGEYKKLYDAAQLKIAKQHGRTRTGGKPGRPRKQPLPSPPKEVIKITPRKRKRAK